MKFMEKEAKDGERAETDREPAERCSASALIVAALVNTNEPPRATNAAPEAFRR